MRWQIEIPGEKDPSHIELLEIRNGHEFVFQVDGEIVTLTNPKAFPYSIETSELKLSFESRSPTKWRASVGSELFTVNPISMSAGGSSQSKEVRSLMPGRVLKILIRPGQEVEADQPLLVLEAMKMENEIRSAAAGKVSSIEVKEAQSVESGALLLRFE